MLEKVTGHSERGMIEVVIFPSGSNAIRLTVGGLVLNAYGIIPATQFYRWLSWLNIPVENWERKEL